MNKISEIKIFFEKKIGKNLENLSIKLGKEFYKNLSYLDFQLGLNKYLTNKYNFMELQIKAEGNINRYLRPLIASKIYEKIYTKIIEQYSLELSNRLLEIFDNLLISNASIIKFFQNIGKNITQINCKNIKNLIIQNFNDENENNQKEKCYVDPKNGQNYEGEEENSEYGENSEDSHNYEEEDNEFYDNYEEENN